MTGHTSWAELRERIYAEHPELRAAAEAANERLKRRLRAAERLQDDGRPDAMRWEPGDPEL